MELTNYKESFFQFLYACVKKHGTMYVLENGRVYPSYAYVRLDVKDEWERHHNKLLWAKVTMDNIPLNNKDLKRILESYVPEEDNSNKKNILDNTKVDDAIINEFEALKQQKKGRKAKQAGGEETITDKN